MLSTCVLSLLIAAAPAVDGGQDPGTRLLEAVQQMSADAGVAPTTSDFRTLEDEARTELSLHQKLVTAVASDLPKKDELSELLTVRSQAAAAATKLRAAFGQPPSTLAVQQMRGMLEELVRADQLLASKLRAITDTLQPTAVVVSGGVSLGAYQAGLLHYYSQYLIQHRAAVAEFSRALAEEPMIATGASAGSVNAFLSAITTCRKPVAKPEESLFWKVWMPVGFDGLLNLQDVTTYSMLSRAPLDKAVKVVEDSWSDAEWRDDACRLNVGFTVTREVPRSIPLNNAESGNAGQVRLPIQTERVILTMEGNGGGPPSIRSVLPPGKSDFFVDWGVRTSPGEAFPISVAQLLQASAAFPVAWPPVMLQTNGSPAYFLDGGVFDNNPVRLATRLLEWTSAGASSLNIAQTRLRTPAMSRILFVEPDATTWHEELAVKTQRRDSFMSMYSELTASLVGTARKAELVSTLEYDETGTLRERIDVPLRRWPITGAFMLNFFAFLEEDFRRFDFYSGMADAHEFLSARTAVARLGLSNVEVESQEFRCVLAFRRVEGRSDAHDLEECRLLLLQKKTASADAQRRANNLLVLLDASGAARQAIFECIAGKNCRAGIEFEALSNALASHGFVFSDPEIESRTVIGAVRERAHPFISEFARRQPFPESVALAVAGKAGLDAISVRPSTWYLGVGMHSRSGFELEFSRRAWAGWRPFTFGARVLRIQPRFLEALRPQAEEFNSVTVEGYWHPLSVEGGFKWVTARWPFWLRFGAALGVSAELTTLDFKPAAYRFPVEANITATILQRVYLRASGRRYPFDECPNEPCGIVSRPEDAAQLAGNRGDWMVSVGWRWID